ncbi:MAG: hypothetical protein EOM58_12700 [Clostridia bacterium]|nr:hypothetical protein [Clostridia bacterium]
MQQFLGIDIGSLTACVLCGYPGTIASTWQQAGRAGRRKDTALTVLVASSAAIDQYIVNHPEYFLSQSPEHALLHPDNLYVLLSHIKCSAYELPFEDGETFGNVRDTAQYLTFLAESGILRHVSVGYSIDEIKVETRKGSKIHVMRALKWTPHELSLTAIGADPGARVIRTAGAGGFPLKVISRAQAAERLRRLEQAVFQQVASAGRA